MTFEVECDNGNFPVEIESIEGSQYYLKALKAEYSHLVKNLRVYKEGVCRTVPFSHHIQVRGRDTLKIVFNSRDL